eukprot:GHVU01134311.1.p1 GENE.GHVU01134311.1~~GHVU01134311.1.p1  ORF type:complete len:177 (+),score=30.05 GHVU01134311.1:127-657(+)
MLPGNEQVQRVYMDEEGILAGLRPDTSCFLINCGTISPDQFLQVREAATRMGHRMVDAPVSGGVNAAAAAELTFFVGGDKPDFETAEEILLNKMGTRLIHCGGPSAGHIVKVCNNLILGATMLGVCEGYRLARQLGVSPRAFDDAVNASSGGCWTTLKYNPVPGIMPGVPAARSRG